MGYIEEIQNRICQGKADSAMEILEEYKNSSEYCFNDIAAILEGSIYLMQHDYVNALDSIYQGIAINPYNSELYFMLGQLKEQTGNYHQAQFSFENALYYSSWP